MRLPAKCLANDTGFRVFARLSGTQRTTPRFRRNERGRSKEDGSSADAQLTPIVCIGERDKKNVSAVLTEQFRSALSILSDTQFARIVIAYEPVWAIGAGETKTPDVAAYAHRLIRALAKEHFGAEAENQMLILYGGSVNPDNAESLMAEPEIDGFLVGGASLDPGSFGALVNLDWDQRKTGGVDNALPGMPVGSSNGGLAVDARTGR